MRNCPRKTDTDLLALDGSQEQATALAIFDIGQLGPVIAAFVITALIYGPVDVRDLAGRITRWRVAPRWYLTVLVLPLLLSAVSLAAAFVTNSFSLGTFSPGVSWSLFIPFLLYMFVCTGFVEEPGGRRFALPHLQAKYTAERSSWILGFLWGVWHIPFTIYHNRDEPWLLLPSLLGLTVGTVGWTIVITWIYNSTSSVWLIMLLHGWNNTVQSYFVLSQENYLAETIFAVFPWVIAIYLTRRYGEEHLAEVPRPTWWPGLSDTEQRRGLGHPAELTGPA